jgi:hypothetical protein
LKVPTAIQFELEAEHAEAKIRMLDARGLQAAKDIVKGMLRHTDPNHVNVWKLKLHARLIMLEEIRRMMNKQN